MKENIVQGEKHYVNSSSKRSNRFVEVLGTRQRYDDSNILSLRNRRESSNNDRYDNRTIQGEWGSYRGGRAQNSVNLKRNPKTGVQTPFLRVVHTFTDYAGRKRNVIKVVI